MDDKDKRMLDIAKKWEDYLFRLDENERKEVFINRDKYWEEFSKFENNFLKEHFDK